MSDHQCIEFSLRERSHPVNSGSAAKEEAPPGTQDDSAKTSYKNILKKPGSYMSLAGLSLLGRWTPCGRRDGKWSQHVITSGGNDPLQRLQSHMVRENGLSENQFGFRKGRSTVDAIQAVVDIATKARRRTGKRTGFCALISIDIRNAFNTARWNI